MDKKVKKRIRIRFIPLLVALFIGVLIYSIYSFIVGLPIKNIYISGNIVLSDQEIIELASIEEYPSFLKTTKKNIKKGILKSEYVDNVKIKKRWGSKVYIEINEKVPLFINNDGLLVLSDGTKIENVKNISAPFLINYVPDTKYDSLIQKMASVDIDILNKISEIKYDATEQDKDRFKLLMNDENVVYLTLTKFDMINYYNTIIGEIGCNKGILNLDSGNHFEIKKECKK